MPSPVPRPCNSGNETTLCQPRSQAMQQWEWDYTVPSPVPRPCNSGNETTLCLAPFPGHATVGMRLHCASPVPRPCNSGNGTTLCQPCSQAMQQWEWDYTVPSPVPRPCNSGNEHYTVPLACCYARNYTSMMSSSLLYSTGAWKPENKENEVIYVVIPLGGNVSR